MTDIDNQAINYRVARLQKMLRRAREDIDCMASATEAGGRVEVELRRYMSAGAWLDHADAVLGEALRTLDELHALVAGLPREVAA